MPTRENKKTPSTTWAVFFASNELAPGGKRNIQQACRASNGRVQVFYSYVRSLVLHWRKAVKFDQASRFATKHSKLPKGITKVRLITTEGLPISKPSATSVGSAGEGTAVVAAASSVFQAASGSASSVVDHSVVDHSAFVSCSLVVASPLGWPRLAPMKLCSLLTGSETPFPSEHDFGALLGQGAWGAVYKSLWKGLPVAKKVLQCSGKEAWRLPFAMSEVSTFAAVEPHKSLIALLDVELVSPATIILVFPLFGRTLSCRDRSQGTQATPEEVMHIAGGLLAALGHLHTHGIIHTDVKPSNVLIDGPGIPRIIANAGRDHWALFARRLLQLPECMRVCLSDLGSAEPGDPDQRRMSIKEESDLENHWKQ